MRRWLWLALVAVTFFSVGCGSSVQRDPVPDGHAASDGPLGARSDTGAAAPGPPAEAGTDAAEAGRALGVDAADAGADAPLPGVDAPADLRSAGTFSLDTAIDASAPEAAADLAALDVAAPWIDTAADAPAPADALVRLDAQVVAATPRGTGGIAGTDRPSARYGHAMAFDQARGKLVLFGGVSSTFYCPGTGLCGDTWEWDGAAGTWKKQGPVTSPPARNQHAMVYDPVRQRVLLFGGYDGAFRQDTWEWDGSSWTDVTPTGAKPSPRQNAGLVWDAQQARALLFGGGEADGANPKADTWEWDGKAWTDRTPAASPPKRQGHALAYDPTSRTVLMFGGSTGSGYLDDTWTWNGATGAWSQLPVAGPSKRFFPRMEYDQSRDHLILYGGWTSAGTAPEVWQWERNSGAWLDLGTTAPMPSRCYHSMSFDPLRGNLLVFAGVNIAVANGATIQLDDLWEL